MEGLLNLGKMATATKSGGIGPTGSAAVPGRSEGMPDLASLLGPDFKGKDMAHLSKQADALWKMLDEMAESDPEAYKSFLKQQADAASKEKAEEEATSSGGSSNINSGSKGRGMAAVGAKQAGVQQVQSSGKTACTEEDSMRRLVQGGAPVMVLELQAGGLGLPPEGIKVAILIWSASPGGGGYGFEMLIISHKLKLKLNGFKILSIFTFLYPPPSSQLPMFLQQEWDSPRLLHRPPLGRA